MLLSFFSVGLGAALGANMRWLLGLVLNPFFVNLPGGTLAANWLGCYLIGIALPVMNDFIVTSPEARLFVVTGFLGGLTTFSSFSAEMVNILINGRIGWAAAGILLHVLGSLTMTFLGMGTVHLIQHWSGQ